MLLHSYIEQSELYIIKSYLPILLKSLCRRMKLGKPSFEPLYITVCSVFPLLTFFPFFCSASKHFEFGAPGNGEYFFHTIKRRLTIRFIFIPPGSGRRHAGVGRN